MLVPVPNVNLFVSFWNSCPVEPTIFPKFAQNSQSALISEYEAFRFTESYGVIFQCNVKYCLGPCPPVSQFIQMQ